MRLLNTTSRLLHEFASNEIPEYAIFSHTWGASEDEVLFVDVERGCAESKVGFAKVDYACVQALEHKVSWIWIDTCCIDKSSSADLSEAINSMFKWYAGAMTCYAYLADVDYPLSMSQFAASRWFTRGWTLQELIAPSSLIFFSKDWKRLGEKSTMYENLSTITGVDADILTSKILLKSTSIAKRMSWAAERKTGRPEDLAYCLMGLLDVNMPMLYGEGEKAFIRLQEEVMKNSDDQSLFSWRDTSAQEDDSYHGLLATHPRQFANCGIIVPYVDWEWRTPYFMTNRGLQIDLHLSPVENDCYVAALGCPAPPDFHGFLGIYLRRISSGDHQYARVRPNDWCHIITRGDLQTIYVRQNFVNEQGQAIHLRRGPSEIYPVHAIQLRRGPRSADGYTILDVIHDGRILKGGPIMPAQATTWVPRHLKFAFPLTKGRIQMSCALLFEREDDGKKVLVLLGSTADFGVGFSVLEWPEDDTRPTLDALDVPYQKSLFVLGQDVIVGDHRVLVTAGIKVLAGVKFYMVDIEIQAIVETPSGIITRMKDHLIQFPISKQPALAIPSTPTPSSRRSVWKNISKPGK